MSDPEETSEIDEPPAPPRSLRIGIATWLALAAFTVFYLIYLLAARPSLRSALVERGMTVPEIDGVLRGMIIDAIISAVVFGGLLMFFALRVRAGRAWAAVAVSATGFLLVFLALFGGDAALCAVAFLLSTVGLVFTWLPSSRRWLAETRQAD